MSFLSSQLANKRDKVVTIFIRCMCVRPCIRLESNNLISGNQAGFRWLVGCLGFNGPLRQYFSLYQAVSKREGERGEKG